MREQKAFDFLKNIYLPVLINKKKGSGKKQLNIWCAGCASGEEAYSLAITVSQTIPDPENWQISILATDINTDFLDKAKKATYTKWSFRNTSDEFRQSFFSTDHKGSFRINNSIRNMVTFRIFNLAAPSYENLIADRSSFDIIFCRNVLIYFSNEGIRSTTKNFFDVLTKGGILVVSPVEVSNLISSLFNTLLYTGFTLYHKGEVTKEIKTIGTKDPAFHLPTNNQTAIKYDINLYQTEKKEIQAAVKPELKPVFETHPIKITQKTNEAPDFPVPAQSKIKTEDPGADNLLDQARQKANQGALLDAEVLCSKAIEQNKLNPAGYYLLATILQERGNNTQAIQNVNHALYLDPDFVLAHFLRGTLVTRNGNATAGKKSFRNALSLLSKYKTNDILPESEGLTAGRFKEIIQAISD